MDAKKLGLRIRQARERLAISQEDLAAAISKDQKAISEYENGKRKLAVTELPDLAMVLQVSVNYFFEDETNGEDRDAALLNYFHELSSPDDQQAIIDVMRILTDLVRRNQG